MIPPTNSADFSSIDCWLVLLDLHVGHVSPAVSLFFLLVVSVANRRQLSSFFQLVSPNFSMRERDCRSTAAAVHFPAAAFTSDSSSSFVQNESFSSSFLQFHH
ncbi:hypothetical protein SDJN03_11266, partial [Cucurbita argyrosperma subsp. sororia]